MRASRSTYDAATDTKVCKTCGERKAGQLFGKRDPTKRDPYRSTCLSCRNKAQKAYTAQPGVVAGILARRAANPEYQQYIKGYLRSYRLKPDNLEKHNASERERRQTPDGRLARRVTEARRRSRKRAAAGSFTRSDIDRIRKLQRNRCAACPDRLDDGFHIDHIVALANRGTNHPRNIQLLCEPCNLSKGTMAPEDFMRQKHARLL